MPQNHPDGPLVHFKIQTWGGLRFHKGIAHIVCPECKREVWEPAHIKAREFGNYAPLKERGYLCVLCGCKDGHMRPFIPAFKE